MTTIAFDGKTLAADKMASCNGVSRTVTKLFRVGAALVAGSGDADHVAEMVAWLKAGADPATFPAPQRTSDYADMLMIGPDGSIWKYERTPYPIRFEDKHFACGSGRDFALAALTLGCDARDAVAVACQLDLNSGLGIDAIDLAPPEEPTA